MTKPEGATHIERDQTFWKLEKGTWYFWRDRFGWCPYVGAVTSKFVEKMMQL